MLPKRALRFNSKLFPPKLHGESVQSNSFYRFHNRAKFWGASQPVFRTLSLPRQSGIKLKRRHNKTMAWLSAEVTTSLGGLPMYWCYSVFRQDSGENFALSKFILSLKPVRKFSDYIPVLSWVPIIASNSGNMRKATKDTRTTRDRRHGSILSSLPVTQ